MEHYKTQKICYILSRTKISKEILTFGNIEIEKSKFYFDEKHYSYFVGYLYNDYKVKSLHIILPKTSAYVKSYDRQTKWMYFLIKDDDLLEKYKTIWDKVNANIKKESDPVYNKEFLKTKIKSLGDEVTDFYDIKIPKVDSDYTFLAVISRNSVLKKCALLSVSLFKRMYYIEKKVVRHINDNFSNFSSSDESHE